MYFIEIINPPECYAKGEANELLAGQIQITKEQYDEILLPITCVVEDGKLISFEHYDPQFPPLPAPEPTPEEDRDAMLVDLEYRMTLLELGVN